MDRVIREDALIKKLQEKSIVNEVNIISTTYTYKELVNIVRNLSTAHVAKEYPIWNTLTEKEKEIVKSIAIQIPLSCETVATIFVLQAGSDRQKTIDYLYEQYGYFIE